MVINRQNRVRVASRRLEQFLARVTQRLRLPPSAATVCLVTNAQIAKWNRAYRGKSKPTDVLSFPVAPQSPRNKNSPGAAASRRAASRRSCHSESPRLWRGEESAFQSFVGSVESGKKGKGTRLADRHRQGTLSALRKPDRHRQGTASAVPKHRRGSGVSTPEADGYLGDIAIAPAVARRNARRADRSLDDELRVLILHGVLHLLGYDHETDDGEMQRLELRLRRLLEIG